MMPPAITKWPIRHTLVVAVGNYHQYFLVAVSLLQVQDRHFDGVPHGRSAAGIDPAQRGLELPDVVGKILFLGIVQVGGVVEVDDEDLVVAVGILHQRQCGG